MYRLAAPFQKFLLPFSSEAISKNASFQDVCLYVYECTTMHVYTLFEKSLFRELNLRIMFSTVQVLFRNLPSNIFFFNATTSTMSWLTSPIPPANLFTLTTVHFAQRYHLHNAHTHVSCTCTTHTHPPPTHALTHRHKSSPPSPTHTHKYYFAKWRATCTHTHTQSSPQISPTQVATWFACHG